MTDVAQQQLQYEKLTSQLLTRQMMITQAQQSKRSVRWNLILVSILFFVVSKWIMLRSQFKEVFTLFSANKKAESTYQCDRNWSGDPWNIVLGVAYPSINKLFIEEPLSQDQANFLWMSIRTNMIPTQDQIDKDQYCKGLGINPLSYLCGSALIGWQSATGKDVATLQQLVVDCPETTPYHWFLSSTPGARSAILDKPQDLTILLTQGFWGTAVNMGTGTSPQQIYNEIYGKEPPPKNCDTTQQFTGVAQSAATFSMAGAAAGPVGAGIGLVFGAGLGLAGNKDNCAGGGGCAVM